MFRCIIFLINLTILNAKVTELSTDSMRYSLGTCVYTISQKHFVEDETIVVGLPANIFGRHVSTFVLDQIILRSLFIKSSWTLFIQKYTAPVRKTNVNKKRNNNYIIHIRTEMEVQENLEFFKRQSWNPHARFIIITTEIFSAPDLRAIVKILWHFHVLNFIILVPRYIDNNIFDVYTWFPYADGNCGKEINELVVLNSCENGVLSNAIELFPKKVPDKLNNCKMIIRTVLWPPFVISPPNLNRNLTSIPFTEGTEIRLITTVAKFMGVEPVFTISKKYQDWGNLLDNGTAKSGLFKALIDETVDLGMSSLAATQSRMHFLDYTASYAHESITWCVPVAAETPKWMSILHILQIDIWIATSVVFCIVVLLIWRISLLFPNTESKTFQRLGTCYLYNFSATLCTSIDILPLQFHVRMIFILWVYYSFNLCAAFQTYLMSKLTKPDYEYQIKTLNEVFQINMEFGYISGIDIYFADDSYTSRKVIEQGRLCEQVETCLTRIANNRDFAVAVPRTYLNFVSPLYYNNKGKLLLYWFLNNVVSYPVHIFSYKGFPLINRIDDIILRVKSNGLMKKWLADSFVSYMKSRDKLVFDDSENHETVLTYQHLQGAFVMLFFGNLLATICFICEKVFEKVKNWKK